MRLAVVAFIAGTCAWPALAQSLLPGQVLSTLVVQPVNDPNPVLGADGRVHLAYELLVVNPSRMFMTLDKVEIVDPSGGNLYALEGDGLAAMSQLWSGENLRLDPGGSAAVYLDVTFDPGAALPETMQANVTATRQVADANGRPAPLPATAPVPATETFSAAEVDVGRPAVVIDAPLRGGNWVAVNGCCAPPTAHRQGLIPVNGKMNAPERFAIDWVQLGAGDLLYAGDQSKLESYAYYGATVHAVADGTVVNTYDEASEEVPGQPRTDLKPESIGGNMIVVDIGGGNFAFYAHLQRGSLKVKVGDKVTSGQELALLGNTGNSDAPHLHFHVMDGPSPLDADGLPYVFRGFSARGVLTDDGMDAIWGGKAAIIDPAMAGAHRDAMPLNNQVVAFD